jgi:hypothetical protein
VLGNKKDLKKKRSILSQEDLKRLEGSKFREVSAYTNYGIFEAFKLIIQDTMADNIL